MVVFGFLPYILHPVIPTLLNTFQVGFHTMDGKDQQAAFYQSFDGSDGLVLRQGDLPIESSSTSDLGQVIVNEIDICEISTN